MSAKAATPTDIRNTDLLARRLIRAVEPELRRHFGMDRLDNDFVGELYVRLRELLVQGNGGVDEVETHRELVDEFAMTTYLVVATRQPGHQAAPELLVSLRRLLRSEIDDHGLAADQ